MLKRAEETGLSRYEAGNVAELAEKLRARAA